VDTVSAPVDTIFTFPFLVFDKSFPALKASVNRTLRVVSPCASKEIYCPTLPQKCGSTTCPARAALYVPEAEPAAPFYHLRFDQSVLPDTVTNASGVSVLSMATPCEQQPAIPLTFCHGEAVGCGVYLAGSMAAKNADVILLSRLDLSKSSGVVCSADHIVAGTCAGGRQEVLFQAFTGSQNASDVAYIAVDVGQRLVQMQLRLNATLTADGSLDAAAISSLGSMLSRTSELTNPALWTAAQQLAAGLGNCMQGDLLQEPTVQLRVALRLEQVMLGDRSFNVSTNTTGLQVLPCMLVLWRDLQLLPGRLYT
jgi:hypothetical protein